MSQIPEIVADLSSRLFSAVRRIEHDLDRIRRKDDGGPIDHEDARFLCEVQRKIVDLEQRDRNL